MELSVRLEAVAKMVTKGNRVCDVGCDHGYISIYLVKNNISPYVYAMDVNKGPLERAKEHIKTYGYADKIETILSDGLIALDDRESDALVCAGMGGKLVNKILTEGMEKVKKMQELILQPQSEIHLVRAFLREQGFYIDREDMVFEDGKYYPMMPILTKQERFSTRTTPQKCSQRQPQAQITSGSTTPANSSSREASRSTRFADVLNMQSSIQTELPRQTTTSTRARFPQTISRHWRLMYAKIIPTPLFTPSSKITRRFIVILI